MVRRRANVCDKHHPQDTASGVDNSERDHANHWSDQWLRYLSHNTYH